MNKADFIVMINEPSRLGKSELSALKKAESDFPYFQAIQVLLTRTLSNLNHYDFNKQLHKTSLSVPDREILYRYIHDQSAPQQFENLPVKTVLSQEPVKAVEIEIEKEAISDIPPAEVLEMVVSEPLPVDEQVEIEEHPTIKEEEIKSVTTASEPIEPLTVDVTEVVDKEKPELVQDIGQHMGEVHSFTEWLALSKQVGKLKVSPIESTQIVEQKEESKADENEIIEVIAPRNKDRKLISDDSNVEQFENILDKFIRESPRISRPKATFYNPANMAKQSVAEDEDLVSETLANLYHKQGHYKKAIRSYEKLCLIYPHKMAYFADLIQQIKLESKD